MLNEKIAEEILKKEDETIEVQERKLGNSICYGDSFLIVMETKELQKYLSEILDAYIDSIPTAKYLDTKSLYKDLVEELNLELLQEIQNWLTAVSSTCVKDEITKINYVYDEIYLLELL